MKPYIATATHSTLAAGQTWYLCVRADSTATVTCVVTTAAGGTSSPTVTQDGDEFQVTYAPASAGRYIASFTITDAEGDFGESQVLRAVTYVTAVVAETGMPTASDVLDYLGETSVIEPEAALVLAAEAAAQRARCRIPAAYPADLREALLRRCARNLAARSVPVTQFTSFEGLGTSTRVPTNDPEIARLEAPYRRLVVG